jgi:protein-tyrosine-phosphatase
MEEPLHIPSRSFLGPSGYQTRPGIQPDESALQHGPVRSPQVLFVDTHHYFRSRFAEVFFRHAARRAGLVWTADSRGLNPDRQVHFGPVSRHVMAGLDMLGVPYDRDLHFPLRLGKEDVSRAALIVGMQHLEHAPSLVGTYPEAMPRMTFWNIDAPHPDLPDHTIVHMVVAIRELVERIASGEFDAERKLLHRGRDSAA